MGDLISQIGLIASIGSSLISREGSLRRGSTTHPVRLMRSESKKPYRANENRRPYDAKFRIDRPTSPVEPQQNDEILSAGEEWIVWRVTPSPAGSHWQLECMAPPTVAIVPLREEMTDDGQGGETLSWLEMTEDMFYGKVRESSADRQINATSESVMGRLQMSYRSADAPAGFDTSYRVRMSDSEVAYEVLSITVDDENDAWRNAVLAREV